MTLPDRPVAVKTGTTQNWRDAWTIGHTPSLVAGVWVGNTRNEEMKKGADGSKLAAPIWQYFMKTALKDSPVETFTPPETELVDKPILRGEISDINILYIDRASGKLATSLTPETFKIKKNFRIYHSILHFVDKDNPRGPMPENPEKDPMYALWEKAIRNWAVKQGITFENPPTEYDDLHILANQPSIKIISPSDEYETGANPLLIEIEASAPRGIRRIEALIENKIADVIYSPPYILTLNTSGLNVGPHQITVYAYDDIDNRGEAKININLTQSQP